MLATNFAILVGVFILFALSRAYLRYRDGSISSREFIFWVAVWVAAAFVIFYPKNTDQIADRLGVSRGADIVVYSAIIVLFYLAFRIYAALNALHHDITRLVRALAIERAERTEGEQLTIPTVKKK
jgi:hypothetical protein